MLGKSRDHGGGLDEAVKKFGGLRTGWLDLSTGINPNPYPFPEIPKYCWNELPDQAAFSRITAAARRFWSVPAAAEIVIASGASALIAQLPYLVQGSAVSIQNPTYNEFDAAFTAAGWKQNKNAAAQVFVHPNNPDGRLFSTSELVDSHQKLTVIDESFCDVIPEVSHVNLTSTKGFIVLKSFGKFWGLAGVRLGFAICPPELAHQLVTRLGPWAVSGPALFAGASALEDLDWAASTRQNLGQSLARLDLLMKTNGLSEKGGTNLFGLYESSGATALQIHLARHHIWSRIFPYSNTLIRFGLPGSDRDWSRLEIAMGAYQ